MTGGIGRRFGNVPPPRIPKVDRRGASVDLREREQQRRQKLAEQLNKIRVALSKGDAR